MGRSAIALASALAVFPIARLLLDSGLASAPLSLPSWPVQGLLCATAFVIGIVLRYVIDEILAVILLGLHDWPPPPRTVSRRRVKLALVCIIVCLVPPITIAVMLHAWPAISVASSTAAFLVGFWVLSIARETERELTRQQRDRARIEFLAGLRTETDAHGVFGWRRMFWLRFRAFSGDRHAATQFDVFRSAKYLLDAYSCADWNRVLDYAAVRLDLDDARPVEFRIAIMAASRAKNFNLAEEILASCAERLEAVHREDPFARASWSFARAFLAIEKDERVAAGYLSDFQREYPHFYCGYTLEARLHLHRIQAAIRAGRDVSLDERARLSRLWMTANREFAQARRYENPDLMARLGAALIVEAAAQEMDSRKRRSGLALIWRGMMSARAQEPHLLWARVGLIGDHECLVAETTLAEAANRLDSRDPRLKTVADCLAIIRDIRAGQLSPASELILYAPDYETMRSCCTNAQDHGHLLHQEYWRAIRGAVRGTVLASVGVAQCPADAEANG